MLLRKPKEVLQIKSFLKQAVLGFAIGDAVGIPYEFKKRDTFRCMDMRESRWNDAHFILPLGAWSDDTSLMLCVLDALSKEIAADKVYKRWRKNAIAWAYLGKFTNHIYLIPYDIGISCRRGINCMIFHKKNRKANDIRSNGNGGLMRMLPLAFLEYKNDEERLNAIQLFNCCSHNHIISHIGCLIYVKLLEQLCKDKRQLFPNVLHNVVKSISETYKITEYMRIWNFSILDCSREEIKSSGYVVDTLEAAIWCVAQSQNFEDAILKAVNLGDDTDTVAAVCGSMAGIMFKEIPEKWVKSLRKRKLVEKVVSRFNTAKEERTTICFI